MRISIKPAINKLNSHRFGIGIVALALVVGLVGGGILMPTKPVQASFDHSQCQYPERTTNPPDGCDNSDPCDPANVKGGSGDCNDGKQGPCAGYPNGVCESCPDNSCTGKDATPPDPNRDQYDMWGNRFTYDGKLVSIGSCTPDPISGKANPYCAQSTTTSTPPATTCTGK